VSIDPASQKEHTNSSTRSVSDEDTQGTSRTEGSKTTTEESQSTKGTEVDETTNRFTSTLQEKVSHMFKLMQQEVDRTIDSNAHEHSKEVKWNAGLGQASDKDGKGGAGAVTKKKSGGVLN